MKFFGYLEIENKIFNKRDESAFYYKLQQWSVIFLERASFDESGH